ncbi:hypothetical protein ARMGADRAFT_1068217 [Armillaria gallica]|uniref:Uncharacterized protein n=1 Tax=Armillaria gallica TaxID=47427 RepID=A0A2H3CKI7_ARMGA|nr:hypothetical protein ARMGADRAFT_1068217 [Armillaria gallica]
MTLFAIPWDSSVLRLSFKTGPFPTTRMSRLAIIKLSLRLRREIPRNSPLYPDATLATFYTSAISGQALIATIAGEHAPHEWVSFEWEQQSRSPAPSFDDPTGQTAIDRGYTGAERLLKRALVGSDGCHPTRMNLSRLESDMELLSASYFWNYWQTCNFPKVLTPDYVECDSFRFMTASGWDRVVAADFTRTETRARLEVVIWRAATIALMRGTGLPELVDMGVDRVPLRWDSTIPQRTGFVKTGPGSIWMPPLIEPDADVRAWILDPHPLTSRP